MNKPLNKRIVTVKVERIELLDLMLACTALNRATDEDTTKWARLHDKLKDMLTEFDSKQEF